MSFELGHIVNALPEMFVLSIASLAILGELFLSTRCKHITYSIVQLGLLGAIFLLSFQVGEMRSYAFSGLFVSDDISSLLKLFICITAFFGFYYSRQYVDDKKIPSGEFYILGLLSVLGMMVLVSAHSLLTIYLGLELMSLPLYALIALKRHCGIASEAAMKYFVMGAIASGILLYGMSMLYGALGSLDLATIVSHSAIIWKTQPLMLSFAVVFLVVGVCFKLAVVPFHMWAPDVYQGAPSAVAILISSAPKLAATGMLFRLFSLGPVDLVSQWQPLFIMVSILSVILGNFLAVVQKNIKRLFAYSGIAHMGYLLFGVIAASPEGYAASLYYICVYGITAVAGFGLLIIMSRLDLEVETIDDLRGLNGRSPWLAGMMLIVLFSMAGVPPMVGFFAKLLVLKALVKAGYITIALIGLLCAVVGAFNYIRIIKTMYFEAPVLPSSLVISKGVLTVYSVNALMLVSLGLFPGALVLACMNAFIN